MRMQTLIRHSIVDVRDPAALLAGRLRMMYRNIKATQLRPEDIIERYRSRCL